MKANKAIKGIKLISKDIGKLIKREIDFVNVRPKSSTLFLTYRCNSCCKTCSFWKRPQQEEKKKEICLEKWKIIIDKLADAGVKDTEIFGGNVFLRKDLLIPLLRYMKEKKFTVHLPTNQIGLDDEIADALHQYVDSLYVSTDGVEEHQDLIRGQKGASQRVENSINKLLLLRQNNKDECCKLKRIVCNTTVSKYNVEILDKITEYAINVGFDEIHFELAGEMTCEDIDNSKIRDIKPNAYYIKQEESILLDHKDAATLHNKLKEIRKKYSSKIKMSTINIDSISVENIEHGTIPHKKCYQERYEVTVDPSGNMVGCLFFNNFSYGNLLENSFDEIWNKENHKLFRNFQNSGKFAMCKHCIIGIQRNPTFYRSLKRIYYTRIQNSLLKRSKGVS